MSNNNSNYGHYQRVPKILLSPFRWKSCSCSAVSLDKAKRLLNVNSVWKIKHYFPHLFFIFFLIYIYCVTIMYRISFIFHFSSTNPYPNPKPSLLPLYTIYVRLKKTHLKERFCFLRNTIKSYCSKGWRDEGRRKRSVKFF